MIDQHIELNISEADLEFVQSREQLAEFLNALGIVEPMFQPDDADQAGVILPMLTRGGELGDWGDYAPQIAFADSWVPQSILIPELENIERLSHLAETIGHVGLDMFNALSQIPLLSGIEPGSLGNGSGPDMGFMSHRSGGATSQQEKLGWAAQGNGTVPTDYRFDYQSSGESTGGGHTWTTRFDDGGTQTVTTTTYGHNHDVQSRTVEVIRGDSTSTTTTTDGNGNTQRRETGHYDDDGNYHRDTATAGGITKDYDKGTPDSQPNPNGPSNVGGVFNPEVEFDPRLNPWAPVDGKTLEQRFAELETSQTTELTWQEQLRLEDMMVTNPGLPMSTSIQTDTFVFSTPHINPDGSNGPDPEPIGPGHLADASVAAPALGSAQTAQIVGDFPTDTIDPHDGLIGGPIFDEFLF